MTSNLKSSPKELSSNNVRIARYGLKSQRDAVRCNVDVELSSATIVEEQTAHMVTAN